MIIFESTLTTIEASFIFWGSWGSIKNWLELKIKPPLADLALLNPWNTLCMFYCACVCKTDSRYCEGYRQKSLAVVSQLRSGWQIMTEIILKMSLSIKWTHCISFHLHFQCLLSFSNQSSGSQPPELQLVIRVLWECIKCKCNKLQFNKYARVEKHWYGMFKSFTMKYCTVKKSCTTM